MVSERSAGNTRGSPQSSSKAEGLDGPQPHAEIDNDEDVGSTTLAEDGAAVFAQQDAVFSVAAFRLRQHLAG